MPLFVLIDMFYAVLLIAYNSKLKSFRKKGTLKLRHKSKHFISHLPSLKLSREYKVKIVIQKVLDVFDSFYEESHLIDKD